MGARLRLEVRDFRRLEELTADVERPVCCVVGPNRSGKSSAVYALTTCLVGKHPDLHRRREDTLQSLVRGGAKEAILDVTLPAVLFPAAPAAQAMRLRRTVAAPKGHDLELFVGMPETEIVPGKKVGGLTARGRGIGDAQAILCDQWGVTQGQLAAVLSASSFLDLSAKDQMRDLSTLAGIELTYAELFALIGNDDATSLLPEPEGGWADATGLELLDDCLAHATRERRDAKKAKEEAERVLAEAERAVPSKPKGEQPKYPEALHTTLAQGLLERQKAAGRREELTRLRDAAAGQKGTAEQAAAAAKEALQAEGAPTLEAIKAANESWQAATQKRTALEKRQDALCAVANARDDLKKAEAEVPDAELVEAKTRELAETTEEREAAQETFCEAHQARVLALRERTAREEWRTSLGPLGICAAKSQEACCPTCLQAVEPEVGARLIADADKQVAEATEALRLVEKTRDTAAGAAGALQTRFATLERSQRDLDLRVQTTAKLVGAAQVKVAEAEAVCPELPEDPAECANQIGTELERLDPDALADEWRRLKDEREPLEAALRTADQQLQRVEEDLATHGKELAGLPASDPDELAEPLRNAQEWCDWDEANEAHIEARATFRATDEAVAHWQFLVERFGYGPDSLRTELVADKLDPFVSRVNEVLHTLTGGEAAAPAGGKPLTLRADVGEGDHWIPATPIGLSGSETLALKVALQYAFARALGVPLLLVDFEAALDAETDASLLSLFRGMTEDWPELTVIAAMVEGPEDWLLGQIAELEATLGGLSVGSQTESAHEQIAELEARLAEVRTWCQTVRLRDGRAVEDTAW